MSAVPLAGELHASIRPWGSSPSSRHGPWQCRALCDLQQLHRDTVVPRNRMYLTHKHKEVQTHNLYNNVTVYIRFRNLSRRMCGGSHFPASGRGRSAAPRGQRSTPGLTDALTTTWASWQRSWSAPITHTTPPAWPSKSCTSALHNTLFSFSESFFLYFVICGYFQIMCFGFSVSVLGEYNYTSNVKQLQRRDVFNTIKAYLTSGQYNTELVCHLFFK